MKSDFTAPNQDINRGTEKQCHDCQKKFRIGTREHQCKRCLKPICSDCGSHRRQVYGSIFQLKMHKVCKNCKELSSFISQLVKSQNLGFGKMSDTGKKWMKKITSKPSIFGTDTSQHKTLSRQVFNQLWGSYSYQLRQLVGNLTFKYQQDGVYNLVYGVYTTVISSIPHYTLVQIIHLVVFVLCFCSADKAPFIVLYLIELKDYIKNLKEMMNNYIKVLPFRHQISKIGEYINYRYDRYIDSFLVNCLTVQCSIAMISKIIERKSVEDLLITFASHIFANKDTLLQKCNEKNGLLDHLMLRKCLPEQLITVSKYFKGKNLALITSEVINQPQKNIKKNGQYSQSFQFSPKIEVFQQVDAKIKINLIQRQSYGQNQNNINNEDSFSIHISPNSMNGFNNRNLSPQNFSKGNKLHEQYLQYSPQNSNFSRSSKQEISPRKPAQEQLETIDTNKSKQVSKIHRKYTEVTSEQAIRQCQKCVYTQKYYERQAQKIQNQLQQLQSTIQRVKQQKQALKSQEYVRKTKIIQLQSIKSSQQHKIKQLNTNLKQLYEKTASQSEENKKLQSQLKILKDKLLNETNQTIKLHSQLQQQKRNVKQARQICLQTNKQNQQLNTKIHKLQATHKDLLLQNQKQNIINKKNVQTAQNLKKKLGQYERKQEQYLKTKQQSTQWENIYKELINKNNILKQNLSEYEKSQQQTAKLIKQKEYIISDMEQKSITLKQISQQKQIIHKLDIQTLSQKLKSLQSLYSTSPKQQNEDHKLKQRVMSLQNSNYELKIQNSKLQQEISHQSTLLQQKEKEGNSLLLQKDQFIQKLKQSNQYYKKCSNDKDQQLKRILEENNQIKQQSSKVIQNNAISQSQLVLNSKIKELQLQIIDLSSKLTRSDKENYEYRQKIKALILSSKQTKDENQQLKAQITALKQQIQNNQTFLTQLPLQIKAKQTEISNFKKQLSPLNIIKAELQRQKVEKKQLYRKLQEISCLMMKIQQEKMQIADQLFEINEFLKNKGIKLY